MAKKELLKDREGNIVYPITRSECVITSDGSNVASKQYVDNATAEILNSSPEQLQIINTLGEKLADDENVANAVTKTVADAKMQLFIDLWNKAWVINGEVYGKYDPDNAPDPQHPFYGNELWMTYDEAVDVLVWSLGKTAVTRYATGLFYNCSARTLLPITYNTIYDSNEYSRINLIATFKNSKLEVLRFICNKYTGETTFKTEECDGIFQGSHNLIKVIGILDFTKVNNIEHGFYSNKLEDIKIHGINTSCNLYGTSFSIETFRYLIENSANTSPITLQVAPAVYKKLTNPDNTEWYALNELAISKQILFATA